MEQNICLIPVLIHTLGKDTILMIYQEIHRTIDIEIIRTIGTEATQIIEINNIKTIYREIIQATDQIIKDLTTKITEIDYEITHKIGTLFTIKLKWNRIFV